MNDKKSLPHKISTDQTHDFFVIAFV